MVALPTDQKVYTNKDLEQYLPKQPTTPKTTQPATPKRVLDLGDFEVDWDVITEVFNDPRATPEFYKQALGFLTDLLSHKRGMEQIDVQRQIASTRDITPMINLINNMDNRILKIYELYSTMPDKNSPQAISLATYITQLEKARDDMYAKVAKYYGIDVPSVPFNPSSQGVPTPQTKPSSKGSVLSFAIPDEVFDPERYAFAYPLKTIFGGGLKEVFAPELNFLGLK